MVDRTCAPPLYVTSRTGKEQGEEQEGGDAVTVMQLVSYCLLEQTAHSTSDYLLQILLQLVLGKGQRLLLLLDLQLHIYVHNLSGKT